MRVQIQSVVDKGDMDQERLVLKVRDDADIGDFMLVRTGFKDDDVTTKVYNSFWFPYKHVRARDFVVVYSKQGRSREKSLEDGRKAHFFYWGEAAPLWEEANFAPVLLHAPEWASKPPSELSQSA